MIRNALWKDIFRDINKSKGRFVSIASIIALGVMLFTGVKIAPTDMKATADKYYDDYNLMDLRVISTLGLTDNDVNDIKNIDGVEGVEPSKSLDVLSKVGSEEFVIRMHSIPNSNLTDNNENYINRLKVVEGRLPEKEGECVIGKYSFGDLNINVGDTITVRSGNDTDINESLNSSEYKVVGIVETPYYLSNNIGSSTIGSGTVKLSMFLNEDNFKNDVYTDIYVTVKNTKMLNSYDDEYFEVVDKVSNSIEDISNVIVERRYEQVKDLANSELQKGKEEYETKKNEVETQLAEAQNTIDKSKQQLEAGEQELNSKTAELERSIEAGKNQIAQAEADLKQKEAELNQGIQAFNIAKEAANKEFNKAEESLNNAQNQLDSLIAQKNTLEDSLNNSSLSDTDKADIQAQIDALNSVITKSTNDINSGKAELQANKDKLATEENKLNLAKTQIQEGKNKLSQSKIDLENAKTQGYSQIQAAKEEIAKGKEELAEGEKELAENREKAEEELSKAEDKIKEAEEEVSKIEVPELYVLDRKSHYSYVDYENNAKSIDKLSNVFPAFFFIVAALVCLTTMTRMVDEQRVNIGTLKALGYSKGNIAKKFIVYALFASLIGCIIGVALGFTILPTIIFEAYGMMYMLPSMQYIIDIPLAIMVFVVAIGVTTLSTYGACRIDLIEVPSMLMRPKAPKEGKRILLERIPFIWNKLSFIGKVTVRNIFRYKKRFLMTVIGIAGSTALLVTGFGLKDSIKSIVDTQYGKLTKYEISVNLQSNIDTQNQEAISNFLKNDTDVKDFIFVKSESGKASANDTTKDVSIIVTDEGKNFDNFEHLQNRKTQDTIYLPTDGIAISEKLAKLLDVKVGDKIEIVENNDNKAEANVSAIVEHYINHFIYIDSNYYKSIFGITAKDNSILVKLSSEDIVSEISNDLIDMDGVSGIVSNSGLKANFDDTIKSLDLVVFVMICCAGALSFIVLYNLTNVNISERIREIATIKVLGFYDKEVSAYIFRENILLTAIGALAGLLLGVVFHRFIMVTVEMDYVMFGRQIKLMSFIMAGAITMIFSLIVNWAMYYKLKNVKMVESLKSVD